MGPIISIIGVVFLGISLAGTIALLIMGSDVPRGIKIFTWVSILPTIVCFAILSALVKESEECKVKYRKVNVELYEKVE